MSATDLRHIPRTLDYHILRVCERLHLRETDFHALQYDEQVQLLGYHLLRLQEESPPPS